MSVLVSLFLVLLIAVICPIICHFIPHKLLPEIVLLLILGMVIGRHGLGIVVPNEELNLLRDIGMAFLFLLAGYEVNQQDLVSKLGRNATISWMLSFILAIIVVTITTSISVFSLQGMAVVIAMTATALGTILPILKDRDLLETAKGRFILTQGAVGEVGPIILMALILSVHTAWLSLVFVGVFVSVTVLVMFIRQTAVAWGIKLIEVVHFESNTTAQLTIRITAVLMVGLVVLADSMGIDLVLGAFAAGFIIRDTLPDGLAQFEAKIDGLGYGFFIPIFFVISGMEIDPVAVIEKPITWVAFMLLLIVVRGLPVFLISYLPMIDDLHLRMNLRQRISAALYTTTNLPIIVAISHVAISQKIMTETIASTLVIAGAASVLIMPLAAFLIAGKTGEVDHPNTRL